MKTLRFPHALLLLVVLLVAAGVAIANAPDRGGPIGPDVIVGEMPSVSTWGTVGGIIAYSVGTTSCNIGDQDLLWEANNPNHPVIAQNLYRLKDDRFEHIGQSWLKHGFTALAGDACNLGCNPPGTGTRLGVGCSDPYSSGLNGSHSRLGPRFEVNATTGDFLWPYTDSGQSGNAIYKRLQVETDDVTPAMNPGARYFIEGHYITPDDAAAGNGLNNASYREVTVDGGLDLDVTGPTERTKPAIQAWQDVDPSVVLTQVDVPLDGRFTVGAKVISLGGGMYRYNYAVHNLNSHRSGQSFAISMPTTTTVTNVGFRDVPYHSGEPYSNTDWAVTVAPGSVTWETEDFATNADANALRWGTMYSFWFDADEAPGTGAAALGLFRPGTEGMMMLGTLTPGDNSIFIDGFESGDTTQWSDVLPFF